MIGELAGLAGSLFGGKGESAPSGPISNDPNFGSVVYTKPASPGPDWTAWAIVAATFSVLLYLHFFNKREQ